MSTKRLPKLLTKEQFEKLNTKRLLTYKNKLMKYPNDQGLDWADGDNKVLCKTDDEWKDCNNALKKILALREHVERKSKDG